MKGIVSLLEVVLTSTILIVSLAYFFPAYKVSSDWNEAMLRVKTRDALLVIENKNYTYDIATDNAKFEDLMSRLFSPQYTNSTLMWWKTVDNLSLGQNTTKPYFTRSYEDMIVDVVVTGNGFEVYSVTLGLGTPF